MNEAPIRIEALGDQKDMEDLFHQSLADLAPAMDLTVNDDRAEIGDVEITDVWFQGNVVSLSYEFDWSAHYTCDGVSTHGKTQNGTIAGVLGAGFWVFPRFIPPTPRTTHEEF